MNETSLFRRLSHFTSQLSALKHFEFWMGLKLDSSNRLSELRTDKGEVRNIHTSLWAPGQPNFTSGLDCIKANLDINSMEFGWANKPCWSTYFPVCQTSACLRGQIRCRESQRCIPATSLCDG